MVEIAQPAARFGHVGAFGMDDTREE